MGVLFASGDYYSRAAALDGSADGKVGTISFWFRLDGGDGARQFVFAGSDVNRLTVERTAADAFIVDLKNGAGTSVGRYLSASTYTASSTVHHFVTSWDLANNVKTLYVDDSEDLGAVLIFVDDTVKWTGTTWVIPLAGLPLNGALAELYVTNELLDLSVGANRRKLRNADGTPANLGADGSLPTGTPPLIYLSGGKDAFPVNRGTGGSFVIGGGAPTTIPFPAPEDTKARTRHRLGADYYR